MSKMKHFVEIVNGFQPLTIFPKHSVLDVWQGSEYVSACHLKSTVCMRETDNIELTFNN